MIAKSLQDCPQLNLLSSFLNKYSCLLSGLFAEGLGCGRLDLRQLDVNALSRVVQGRRLEDDASRSNL